VLFLQRYTSCIIGLVQNLTWICAKYTSVVTSFLNFLPRESPQIIDPLSKWQVFRNQGERRPTKIRLNCLVCLSFTWWLASITTKYWRWSCWCFRNRLHQLTWRIFRTFWPNRKFILLLMVPKNPAITSWYGKYYIIYRVCIHLRWLFGISSIKRISSWHTTLRECWLLTISTDNFFGQTVP